MLIPLIIKNGDSKQTRKLLDMLRRYLPKHFFKVIQTISKGKKRSLIAIGFKDKLIDGRIEPEVTIAEYLEELYRNEKDLEWPVIP